MMKKISVIIPSYNSVRTIEHTFKALESQTGKDLIYEIIVVDSSDDNKTKKLLFKYNSTSKITIINANFRTMPAIARNMGAEAAQGDILAFIDSDAYPADDWIEQIMIAYSQGYKVGGGSIALPEFQKNKLIPLSQYYLQFNEYMEIGQIIEKKFVPSCNIFCDKELFEKVGGFPAIRAAEDVLFGLKASKIEKLWFIPKIKIYHIFREKMKEFLKNQFLLGKYIIIYRRIAMSDKVYYKRFWPLLFLPLFVLIKLIRITSRVFRNDIFVILRYLLTLPLFLFGLFFWSIGFAKGVILNENS